MADSGFMTEWQADALIPHEIWYAGWRDAPRERRPLTIGSQPVKAPTTRTGFIDLMARLMVERAAGHDACTEADLTAAGFTADEIALYAAAARQRARVRMAPRQVAA